MIERLTLKEVAMSGTLNNLTEEQVRLKVAEAEKTIEDSEVYINRYKSLRSLLEMDEFIDVFDSGYLGEYAQEAFSELTTPPQFASIPFKDCEDLLCGIKAMKTYIGGSGFKGKVQQDAEMWMNRRDAAQSVINAIGI